MKIVSTRGEVSPQSEYSAIGEKASKSAFNTLSFLQNTKFHFYISKFYNALKTLLRHIPYRYVFELIQNVLYSNSMPHNRLQEIAYIEPSGVGRVLMWVTFILSGLVGAPTIIRISWGIVVSGNFNKSIITIALSIVVFPAFAFVLGTILGYIYNYVAKRGRGIEVILRQLD